MNILLRRIGIWFTNPKWARYIWETLVDDGKDYINFEKGSGTMFAQAAGRMKIVYKDGSTVTFIPLHERSRGYKFTESYIEIDNYYDTDFVDCVVRPATYGSVYGIKEYEELNPFVRRQI